MSVEPSISSRGPGTASLRFDGTSPSSYGTVYNYTAIATPNQGAHFVRFEFTRVNGFTGNSVQNPLPLLNVDWDPQRNPSSDDNLASIVAVFEYDSDPGPEPEPGTYTVKVSAVPAKAVRAQRGGGNYNQGDTCTIETERKCSPWVFDRWELSPGGTVRTETFSFVVTANTSCVAYYTHTDSGMPYYDADGDGEIICNSSGSILYDGDNN